MGTSLVTGKGAADMRYGPLPEHLRLELFAIEPSVCGDLAYRPCTVTLLNGDVSDIVYVVDAVRYIGVWGIWPEEDSAKRSVRIEDVASVEESPCRLPAKFADEVYKAGETGMGYTIFTVVFTDGTKQACSAGNAIDFVRYPPGKGPGDVVSVLPHEGRNADPLVTVPHYCWCLYSA